MNDLLRNWDIGDIACIERIDSYWDKTARIKTMDGRAYILKAKSDLPKVEQELKLLARLYEAGAPVAVPIWTVDRMRYAKLQDQIFCLYRQLPGEIITEHYAGDATARAESLGEAIASLHSCFLKCDAISGYQEMRLIDQIRKWAIPCVRDHKTMIEGDQIEKIWQEVEQELDPAYDVLPTQLIHRDLHPANMLFDGGALTGFLDFELVLRGPRIFDLCYCGTSLLVSGFPDSEKMQRWPTLFRSLVKGYQAICQLTPMEISTLYATLVAIELLFVAFSLETRADEATGCNTSILKWLSTNRERIV